MRIKDILFFLKKFPKKKVLLLEALGVATQEKAVETQSTGE